MKAKTLSVGCLSWAATTRHNQQVWNYRDPRAGVVPPGGYPNWQAAQTQQVLDWNTMYNLPDRYRLGEYPVSVIEGMPPTAKGRQRANGQWDGDLALVKLSVPIVFPVNNYLVQRLDLAMSDTGLGFGVVDGVNYALPLYPYPRVYFRAAELERALRLTAAGLPGVYAFNDQNAVATRAVMNEQNYRDASPSRPRHRPRRPGQPEPRPSRAPVPAHLR